MNFFSQRLKELIDDEKNKLILNPVENLPYLFSNINLEILEGLYITDKVRDEEDEKNSKILFGGRKEYSKLILEIYEKTKELLRANDVTFRPLSGLHAHMMLFLSVGGIGNHVLLLPEIGGGHFATEQMLNNLGYNVDTLPIDFKEKRIDLNRAKQQIIENNYDFLFVDRSEGLNYEDFSELTADFTGFKIFDASQYLTNIICGDFKSPFDMGFDMILSTVHKNFPGGQKAIYAVKDENSKFWKRLIKSCKANISSLHAKEILQTGLTLDSWDQLQHYSKLMIENAIALEESLSKCNLDIVNASSDSPHTAHVWLKFPDKDSAYIAYKKLEENNILVNYRMLPYNLNYGIRMGTCAATIQGLRPENCMKLALIIAEIINNEKVQNYKTLIRSFINV